MPSEAHAILVYASGMEYGMYEAPFKVGKAYVETAGTPAKPEVLMVIADVNSPAKVSIYLSLDLAIPLARNILNVAKGWASKSELEVA